MSDHEDIKRRESLKQSLYTSFHSDEIVDFRTTYIIHTKTAKNQNQSRVILTSTFNFYLIERNPLVKDGSEYQLVALQWKLQVTPYLCYLHNVCDFKKFNTEVIGKV